ncbi:Hpt domain-containing protein [Vibrio sp. ES.051]|uniref:Hpt domain-containing protein n=1 Tax=Vibrio sp. ES.051 TaxID=1761909 RepID=UPI00359C2DED
MQTISIVNELGTKVEEVRHFFNFELPYRVKYVDQIALELQLVYAVRLQLETELSAEETTPDITPLLYATDRFLERARAFIDSDTKLVSLAELLHNSRDLDQNSEHIQSMYYRLGALVLESIFSDSATNTDTYRELDLLFIESDSLIAEERRAFQRRLAQTSSALSANAQGSYLANQLLKPDFSNQLASINAQLEQKLMTFLVWLSAVSGVVLAFFSWAVFTEGTVQPVETAGEQEKEPEHIKNKPLSVDLSFHAKSRQAQQNAETSKHNSPSPTTDEISSEPYIDINKMLDSLTGDEDAVRMLLEIFIQDHCDDGTKMHRLLKEDKDQAKRTLHSLKGVAGSLGAMPLYYISGDIELLIKQGLTVPEDKLTDLAGVLHQTILYANNVLESEKIQEMFTD